MCIAEASPALKLERLLLELFRAVLVGQVAPAKIAELLGESELLVRRRDVIY